MAQNKPAIPKDIEKLGFEEALVQLEKIVGQLESGEAPLDKSIELYERGNYLKAHCEARLKAAEERVEKITLAAGAPTGTEPLDME